jgi:hypothetical protein
MICSAIPAAPFTYGTFTNSSPTSFKMAMAVFNVEVDASELRLAVFFFLVPEIMIV